MFEDDDDEVSIFETLDAVQPSTAVWISSCYNRCTASQQLLLYKCTRRRSTAHLMDYKESSVSFKNLFHLTLVSLSCPCFLVHVPFCSVAFCHPLSFDWIQQQHLLFKASLHFIDGHDTPPYKAVTDARPTWPTATHTRTQVGLQRLSYPVNTQLNLTMQQIQQKEFTKLNMGCKH